MVAPAADATTTQNPAGTNNTTTVIPAIGPATPYPSTLTVTPPNGLPANIAAISVRLNGVTHNFEDDLNIELVGPTGQVVSMMEDVGGGNPMTNADLTICDATDSGVVSGCFIPLVAQDNADNGALWCTTGFGGCVPTIGTNDGGTHPDTLTAYPNGAPNGGATNFNAIRGTTIPASGGTFSLYVYDDTNGDAGSINSWEVNIKWNQYVPTANPTLGAPTVDSSVSATYGNWDNTPPNIYPATPQLTWHVFGAGDPTCSGPDTVVGTTNALSYTPAASDAGKYLQVWDTASGDANYPSQTLKSACRQIAKANFVNNTPPTITGDLQVGHPLTATPGTWTPSGVGAGGAPDSTTTLKYQWYVDGVAVPGATCTTNTTLNQTCQYSPAPSDIGKTITVKVTASRLGYNDKTVESAQTGAVVPCQFTHTSPTTIVGTAKVGETLEANEGSWTPAEDSVSYQWLADGQPIAGATGSTFTVTPAEAGKKISVKVTVTRVGCTSASATSAETGAVANGTFERTQDPSISGDLVVGSQLTVDPGEWSPTPATTTYQWTRGGQAIPGATGSTYTTTAADLGEHLAVIVTVSAPGYDDAMATAHAAGAIGETPISNTTAPAISGSPVAGNTLTASDGTWSVTPDDVTFQWFANGQAIAGATGDSLVLDDPALVGQDITVRATASKAGYASETATSAAVGPVTKAPVTISKSFSTKHPQVGVDQVTVDVTVHAPNGLPVSGTVRILVNGAVLDSGSVDADGSVELTLPAFHNAGKHKVKIKYGGSTLLRKKSVTTFIYPHN